MLLKENKKVLFIVGLFIYMIIYYNAYGTGLYNVDSVSRVFYADQNHIFITGGRFWREIFDNLIGKSMLNVPLTLLVTYLALYLTSTYLVSLFDVKKHLSKASILLVLITCPLINYYFFYGNDIFYYAYGLLFATIAIEKLFKNQYLVSITCVIIALFFYQMVLSYMTSLFALKAINLLSRNAEELIPLLKKITLLLLAGLLYFLLFKWILLVLNLEITSYMGGNTISLTSFSNDIVLKIYRSYDYFGKLFLGEFMYFEGSLLIKIVNVICISFLFIDSLKHAIKNNSKETIFVLSLLPVFVFSTSFLIGGVIPRSEFGIIPLYIYPIIISIEQYDGFLQITSFVVALLLTGYGMLFLHQAIKAVEGHVVYDAQITAKIINDLHQMDIKPNSKIALCGSYALNNQDIVTDKYELLSSDAYFLDGPTMFFNVKGEMSAQSTSTYISRFESVFKRNGYKVNVVKTDCQKSINNHSYFPNDGYISSYDHDIYEINLGPQDDQGIYTRFI